MRRYFIAVIWFALMAPAHGAWREATTDKLIVYSDGSEGDLIDFTQRVDQFDQVMRLMTGMKEPPSPVKLRVYLVNGELAVRNPMQRPANYVRGFYAVRGAGGMAVVDRTMSSNPNMLSGENFLYHEYAHHFMKSVLQRCLPDLVARRLRGVFLHDRVS